MPHATVAVKGGENMAVTKVEQNGKLVVKVETGVNASGNPTYRLRSFQNVKPGAADGDVYAVAQALVNLQQHTVVNVARMEEGNLVNQ